MCYSLACVLFYIKLNNKGHIRKSIAEKLAYLFWQYFNMNVNKRRNCIVIDDALYKFVI